MQMLKGSLMAALRSVPFDNPDRPRSALAIPSAYDSDDSDDPYGYGGAGSLYYSRNNFSRSTSRLPRQSQI